MSGADWLILGVVLLSAAGAAAQGFFFEIFSLAGVVLGYLLAAWGYRQLAPWFVPYVSSPWVADIAGFLTIFIAVTLLAGAVARIARWGVREAGLRWFDRTLGAVFGLARGIVVVMVVALALASFSPEPAWLARSRLAPYLLVLARGAVWLAPQPVRQQFRKGLGLMHDLRPPQEQPPPAKPSPPPGAGPQRTRP